MIEKTLMLNKLLSVYGGLLTDKQKEAIELHYNLDMSLGEIGDELGISRQGVRDSLTRAEHTLIDTEEKLGLCAKLDRIKDSLIQLSGSANGLIKDDIDQLIKILED